MKVMNQYEQAHNPKEEEPIDKAVASLIGAVIGSAIQPDKTRRLANGRMNRPEDRGGEGIEWLDTENGQFWMNMADQIGIDTTVIRQIADDPDGYGYEGVGHGAWDVHSFDPAERDDAYDAEYTVDNPDRDLTETTHRLYKLDPEERQSQWKQRYSASKVV